MRCDSHVHVVGPGGQFPQVSSRTYLADVATLDDLKRRGASRIMRDNPAQLHEF